MTIEPNRYLYTLTVLHASISWKPHLPVWAIPFPEATAADSETEHQTVISSIPRYTTRIVSLLARMVSGIHSLGHLFQPETYI